MAQYLLSVYADLITQFLDRALPVGEFERTYLRTFKDDITMWGDREYLVLNNLFCDIDAYCGDDGKRSGGDLDEQQLRDAAAVALHDILELIKNRAENIGPSR